MSRAIPQLTWSRAPDTLAREPTSRRRGDREGRPMESLPPFVFQNNSATMSLDLRAYRIAAVKKAAYRLADLCTIVIGGQEGNGLTITLVFKPTTTEASAREVARRFFEELLDQELREQLAEEIG